MRKLFASLCVLGALALSGTAPASANPASGLATKAAVASEATGVTEVRWRHRHHRRHGGIYLGFGYPGYYGFYGGPRYYGHRRHYRYGHRGYRNYGYGYGRGYGYGGGHRRGIRLDRY
ncbi:MAG: hypothetical protein K2X41_04985 [Hyphomicrobium sp.]|nr:hypothetical protein [Hyphomicrobium sp.]